MDRLSQERLARAVLDKLLDSGGLRSVASERALALRLYYLPLRVRLDVPPEPPFLPLLNPSTATKVTAELRETLIRIIADEERDHWVAISLEEFALDVSLRERSKVLRATPIYDVAPETDYASRDERLGEPRLRLSWTHNGVENTWVFREGDGLVTLPLQGRYPRVLIFEEPAEVSAGVAHLYVQSPCTVASPDGGTASPRPARTRITVHHDTDVAIRPPWYRFWQRAIHLNVVVLGFAKMGRPDILFSSSEGERRSWNRNREPTIELAADVFIQARGEDQVEVDNHATESAELAWDDGAPLTVPQGASVAVQGSHLVGLRSPAGVQWAASTEGFVAPPPRILNVEGAVLAGPTTSTEQDGADALFNYDRVAARVFQDAIVLPQVKGDTARVSVATQQQAGFIAQVALDDCPGAKVRYPKGAGDTWLPWKHVRGITTLGASGTRLELVGDAQIAFGRPALVRVMTTSPTDVWELGGFKLRITLDGLELEAGPHAEVAEINGVIYRGTCRLDRQVIYRVRAGDGVFRIVRDEDAGLSHDRT